jgi:hypothetical protein
MGKGARNRAKRAKETRGPSRAPKTKEDHRELVSAVFEAESLEDFVRLVAAEPAFNRGRPGVHSRGSAARPGVGSSKRPVCSWLLKFAVRRVQEVEALLGCRALHAPATSETARLSELGVEAGRDPWDARRRCSTPPSTSARRPTCPCARSSGCRRRRAGVVAFERIRDSRCPAPVGGPAASLSDDTAARSAGPAQMTRRTSGRMY